MQRPFWYIWLFTGTNSSSVKLAVRFSVDFSEKERAYGVIVTSDLTSQETRLKLYLVYNRLRLIAALQQRC